MDARAWRARFEAFVAQKIDAAHAATLPPYVTDREQPLESMLAIGNDWTHELFGGPFYLSPSRDSNRPACSLVFVRSADGNTGAANPSDLGGGATDTHLIYEGLTRVAADAVLAGAETARDAEIIFSVWHPELVSLRASRGLARHPVQMVATLRGLDFDRALLFNVPEIPVILLTNSDCAARMRGSVRERPWITTIVIPDRDGIGRAVEQLPALGVKRFCCIGGRRLASSLLEAGVVDDVYLTTAPERGGEPDTPLSAAAVNGWLVVRKRGTLDETGVMFEHFALSRSSGDAPHPLPR